MRPRQNGRHFADDTFKCIFMNENVRISINISLKFVPKGLTNNIPALVQILAWRRPGDKPLCEPVMVNLLTHICVTRPQWVNQRLPIYISRHTGSFWLVMSGYSKASLETTQSCDKTISNRWRYDSFTITFRNDWTLTKGVWLFSRHGFMILTIRTIYNLFITYK